MRDRNELDQVFITRLVFRQNCQVIINILAARGRFAFGMLTWVQRKLRSQ